MPSFSSSTAFVTGKSECGAVHKSGRKHPTPRAYVVLGFGGAQRRHMEKYAMLYNRMGCFTLTGTASNYSLFVNPTSIDDFACDAIRQLAKLIPETEEKKEEEEVKLPRPTISSINERALQIPVVMHIMSNGGAFVVSRINEMLINQRKNDACTSSNTSRDLELLTTRLKGGCQIFDSAPCYLDSRACFNVIKHLIPNPIFGIPLALIFSLNYYIASIISRFVRKPTFGETFWKSMIEDNNCDLQAYIYSCNDDITNSTKLEELIGERRRRGVKVLVKHFPDSQHVQHLRLHGLEYLDFVESVLTEMDRDDNITGVKTKRS
jgi:hypothetical protein